MSLKTDAARPKLLTPNQKKNLKSPAAGRAKSAEKQVMPFTAKELQLIKACESGQVDNVYELLWNNADVNTQMPHSGSSPLLVACQTGNTQIASILISFGAKIKVTDDYGVSTLHWYFAINKGRQTVARKSLFP